MEAVSAQPSHVALLRAAALVRPDLVGSLYAWDRDGGCRVGAFVNGADLVLAAEPSRLECLAALARLATDH